MLISRDTYLQKLIDRRENGAIKVITGLRRVGKSTLLFDLYQDYLRKDGVSPDQIISIALDDDENIQLRDPDQLSRFIRSKIVDSSKQYYLLLDEAQYAISEKEWKSKKEIRLYSVLNGLMRKHNVDIYITGSNSRFLSSDILTGFRGRGDEVRVYPLSFAEFSSVYQEDNTLALQDYLTYGGMPRIVGMKEDTQKVSYLNHLFQETYIKDVIERYGFYDEDSLSDLISILASSTGSLTNPMNLANTFRSTIGKQISDKTIRTYINALSDSFLIKEVSRYDVKRKAYIGSPYKYYFSDTGLRNARLNFRQQDPGHIMENVIFNELNIRGYNVDVGVVDITEEGKKKRTEIDFICNQGNQRYYVQSAYEMPTEEKRVQEEKSLIHVPDFFRKIIVVYSDQKAWRDEKGVTIIGLRQFLLDQNSLDI